MPSSKNIYLVRNIQANPHYALRADQMPHLPISTKRPLVDSARTEFAVRTLNVLSK